MSELVFVVYLLFFSFESVRGAGDATGLYSSPEALEFEPPFGMGYRNGGIPGPGLNVIELDCDVLVAGGGSAGTSAALAAARSGAKTILVHGRPMLGGNAASEDQLQMVGADQQGNRGVELETEAREGGIVEEYTLENCVTNPQRCPQMLDLTLYNAFRTEPNLQLLLNTMLVSVEMDLGDHISTAICEDQGSQNQYRITAKVFIDTTGDGRLGAEAGADFLMGRESQSEYNESLAQPVADNETEGSSLAFVAYDFGKPMPFQAPSWARNFTETDFKYRPIADFQYGYWWIEVSYPYNTITDNEIIRDVLMEDMIGIWNYIKNSGTLDSETWALTWFEWWTCKREGRRFFGQYVQTQNDIMKVPGTTTQAPELYDDRVSYGGWNFDLHNPLGMMNTSQPPYASFPVPFLYSTPLRSLIARNVSNLMFAGRLASFSHVVFGSQRVMKTCATMGQAAGTAAAYAVLNDILPSQIYSTPGAVWSIQQQLLRDDAYIIGLYNEDYRDYAKTAIVTASSEDPLGPASNVISGQTRAVFGPRGVAPGQYINGTNRWISQSLPASLLLELKEPVNISQVHLIFDTGMHRPLALSQSLAFLNNQVWGTPQPETVANYTIEFLDATDSWTLAFSVTGNYQRRRVHNVQENTVISHQASLSPPKPPALFQTSASEGSLSSIAARVNPCSSSAPSQGWVIREDNRISLLANDSLCLTVYSEIAPSGGHGPAIYLDSCGMDNQVWLLPPNASTTGFSYATLRSTEQYHCFESFSADICNCLNAVMPGSTVQPLSPLELFSYSPYKYGQIWSFDPSTGQLMLSISNFYPNTPLCLEAYSVLPPSPPPPTPGLLGPGPFSAVRLNVTATNGLPVAHVNEVRIYDQDGLSLFPKPQS